MMPTGVLSTLLRRSCSRAAGVLVAVAAVLAAFQVLLVLVATSFQHSGSFDLVAALIPLSFQRTIGSGALTLASFSGMVTFGYFHPVIVLAVVQVGIFLATELAGEVEWGLFDFELARPVARHWVVTRSAVLAFGLTAAIVGTMLAGTWGGLWVFAPHGTTWPPRAVIVSLAAHLLLLAWVFAAAALAMASAARRRGTAFAVTALSAVVLYLLNYLGDVWAPASRLRWVSPFHYFPGFAVASGSAPEAYDLTRLAVPVVLLTLVAYWQFNRRDL